jgi:hypothetical protein
MRQSAKRRQGTILPKKIAHRRYLRLQRLTHAQQRLRVLVDLDHLRPLIRRGSNVKRALRRLRRRRERKKVRRRGFRRARRRRRWVLRRRRPPFVLRRRAQRRRLKGARKQRTKFVRLEIRARLKQRELLPRFRKAFATIRFLRSRRRLRQRQRYRA